MCRTVCLVIVLGSLAAAPGCSSCFGGGNSCRRSSFMEFRSPCMNGPAPCAAPQQCQPACEPMHAPACGPACGTCGEGGSVIGAPVSAPVVSDQGTFS